MTNKEIALSAIAGRRSARNAATLMSGGLWAFARRGLKLQDVLNDPARAAEVYAATAREFRGDMIYTATGFYQLLPRAMGATIKFRANGVPDLVTPAFTSPGELDGGRLELIGDDPGMRFLWDASRRTALEVGDEFLVATGMFGPLTVGGQIVSIEQLMRALRRDPPAAEAVLDFATEACLRYILPFIKGGTALVSLADPTASGDMISRANFERFVAPRLAHVVQAAHAAGALAMLHICGDVNDRLDLMRDTGADVLSVDFKVDLDKTRATVAGKCAFAGNLDPVRVMLQETPGEVYRLGRANIERYGGDGNYILMPGCDIPGQVPDENVRALLRAAI